MGQPLATRVTFLLKTAMFPASAPGGNVDPKLKSDDFVLGYIYGVITACDIEGNTEEKGLFIVQVFEQLFPGNGSSLTDACNKRVVQKDPAFKQAIRLGFGEMMELANSGGNGTLHSLLDHVCKHYV